MTSIRKLSERNEKKQADFKDNSTKLRESKIKMKRNSKMPNKINKSLIEKSSN